MKHWIEELKNFAGGIGSRKLSVFAASGCYYMFMSLVPLVMIFCCLLPYTPLSQSLVIHYVDLYFSEELGDIMQTIVSAIYRSNAATMTISILLTLYSASASMKALMKGMDGAYNCERRENFIVFTLRALIYMVLLILSLILSLLIMVYGGKILALLKSWLPVLGALNFVLSRARYLLVMVVLAAVFLLLYKLMPAERVRIRDQVPGALFSAAVWVIFSSVFTLYVQISNKYGAYGIIGTIMVAMMWMYYCLFFLLIGGYINSWLTKRKEDRS